MSVGLLLITHDRIGEELLATAHATLGVEPMNSRCLSVPRDVDLEGLLQAGRDMLAELDAGAGVLILTDAYGSSPSNIAGQLGRDHAAAVVAGLNLPMLLRVLNYPRLSLGELQDKALSGGRDGVVLVESACRRPKRRNAGV